MRFRLCLAAFALLASLCGRVWTAPVIITTDEVWDGVNNPHAADGVTLTLDGTTSVYTIPNGLTINNGAEIFLYDLLAAGPETAAIRFDFAPGGGGLHFGTAGIFDLENNDYTGSAIDTYCGSRGCGGGRAFTLNMNDNNITAVSPGAGAIYNSSSQLLGTSGGSGDIVINGTGNVSVGHIRPATWDAGGGNVVVNIGGSLDVGDVNTADPTAGGNPADQVTLNARSVTLRGTIDTTASRPSLVDNGDVTIRALAAPDYSVDNAAGNLSAQNVFTMTSTGKIMTNEPNLANAGGDISITAVRAVLDSGSVIDKNELGVLQFKLGIIGGAFTQGGLFTNNSGQNLAPSFEVKHDGISSASELLYTGQQHDWNNVATWSPNNVPNSNTSVVTFGSFVTGPDTVFINTDVSSKTLKFQTANRVAIAGPAVLNLDADTGSASVEVTQGSHEFQVRVALQDNTTVNVANALTLDVNNRLTLNGRTLTKTGGGTLNINNRLTTGGGSIVNNGGTIGGGGAIGGDLVNSSGGTVAPGTSPGMLTVTGNYTQQAGSTLRIELGGAQRIQQYDVLNVLGSATLGGTLDVVLIDGFTPTNGQSFDILDFGSVSGNFSAVNLPAGVTWNTTNLLTTGTLQVGAGSPVTGDFDADGDADGADFAAWSTNFGRTGGSTRAQGNSDGDGDVDGSDFLVWQQRFGRTSGAAGAVPEPTTLVLSLVSGLFVARRRR